ncbi:D-aminopeptidase [Paenibacillus sp. D9]|nr:D-aminopeptidase [Paenibacillus sp. D9]
MNRRRFHEYGLKVGRMKTGPLNSIADVPGVSAGHVTLLSEGDDQPVVRTGVTAILPHQGNLFREKAAAASYVINGFGKTAGLIQVDELGTLEGPVMLTNTFGVSAAAEGALRYMMEQDDGIGGEAGSINIVTGECNDSYLNDMRGLHVRPEHAVEAIRLAKEAWEQRRPVGEGAVGAGTGMVCFGWKGGIGTSSRAVAAAGREYHIGVLVLTNFGSGVDLSILGEPIGQLLARNEADDRKEDGSVIIVVATDLPLDSRQLKRVAKRAAFGLGRTGSIAHHGSGDIVIAFSNGMLTPHDPEQDLLAVQVVREDGPLISECFRAAADATEEAVYSSLFAGTDMSGRSGREVHAFPVDRVIGRFEARSAF